jgi:hypothetical protein
MKKLYILIGLIIFAFALQAQTILSEGRVIYNVYLNSVEAKVEGKLIVTLKAGFMKRELILKNGYINTIIYNAKQDRTSSYSDMQGNKLYKILNKDELIASNSKFENASYLESTETKTIAGYKTTKTLVTYLDGSSNTIYYTNEIQPLIKEYNAMFQKIVGLPLQYEVVSGTNKIIMIANTIDMVPINNSEFEALKGYQLITD